MGDISPKILIVGAGPTGLTAAVELARRGVIADVIEKRQAASTLSRAVGILPRSMEILAPSGVAAAIRAEAIRIAHVQVFNRMNMVADLSLDGGEPDKALFALAQDRTETHLADAFHAAGGVVRYGSPLEKLAQTDDGVVAWIGDTEARYDYVIGADGVRSKVRDTLSLDYPGFEIPGLWSIADVDCANWDAPRAFRVFLLNEGGVVIVVPLEAARYRVIANREDALGVLPVPMQVSNVRRAAAFTISVRQVTDYQVGRVFLAGDAAHCHSPAGGRGMNLGIADAADLARRLVEGGREGYHAARHPEGAETIALSERARRMVSSESALTRSVLMLALRVIGILPPLRRAAVRRLLES